MPHTRSRQASKAAETSEYLPPVKRVTNSGCSGSLHDPLTLTFLPLYSYVPVFTLFDSVHAYRQWSRFENLRRIVEIANGRQYRLESRFYAVCVTSNVRCFIIDFIIRSINPATIFSYFDISFNVIRNLNDKNASIFSSNLRYSFWLENERGRG